MGIEVGEFIRFKGGYIRKAIGRRYDNEILIDRHYKGYNFISAFEEKEDVVKHSKNILDVLEVGDIITTKYISTENIKKNELIYIFDYDFLFSLKLDPHFDKNIISILTHEQYESNCYRLEE